MTPDEIICALRDCDEIQDTDAALRTLAAEIILQRGRLEDLNFALARANGWLDDVTE